LFPRRRRHSVQFVFHASNDRGQRPRVGIGEKKGEEVLSEYRNDIGRSEQAQDTFHEPLLKEQIELPGEIRRQADGRDRIAQSSSLTDLEVDQKPEEVSIDYSSLGSPTRWAGAR
jgi:hypothetical protein